MKQKGLLILILIVITAPVSLAVDLPIDIETITRQDDEQRGVLTVRWRVDLFSETSDALNKALADRRKQEYITSKQSLFTEPQIFIIPDPHETVLHYATEARLFSEPIQRHPFIPKEAESGIPLWVVFLVLACALGVGTTIALYTNARRKEYTKNVHHHNR
jgi:hypothetical protein